MRGLKRCSAPPQWRTHDCLLRHRWTSKISSREVRLALPSPTMANNFSWLIKNSHFAWQMILADGTLFPVGVLRTCPSPVFPPARCKKKRREIYWRGQTTSGRAKRKEYRRKTNRLPASCLPIPADALKKIPPDLHLISCTLFHSWNTTGRDSSLNSLLCCLRIKRYPNKILDSTSTSTSCFV